MTRLNSQFRALQIYKKIYRLKRGIYDQLECETKKIEAEIEKIFSSEQPDQETLKELKKLFSKNDTLELDEKINGIDDKLNILLGNIELKNNDKIILSIEGDLYREPRKKYYYSMRNGTKRLKILKILSDKYKTTNQIRKEADIVNNEAVRKYIGEINFKAKGRLQLKEKLIESKNYDGYRINPSYKLIIE